jgi:hypothetical protein
MMCVVSITIFIYHGLFGKHFDLYIYLGGTCVTYQESVRDTKEISVVRKHKKCENVK